MIFTSAAWSSLPTYYSYNMDKRRLANEKCESYFISWSTRYESVHILISFTFIEQNKFKTIISDLSIEFRPCTFRRR